MVAKMKNVKWMSSMDFTASYWQIPIAPSSQKYTGFIYRGISYVYLRTPFGLKNSAAALIQCLDDVINKQLYDCSIVYVDDVVLFASTFEEHLEHLETFFKLLLENHLQLNFEKSHFCRKRVDFLGYQLTTKGLQMNPDKIVEIDKIKAPKNRKQLKSFLGCVNYYSRFVPNFAMAIAEFLPLLRKGQQWKWTDRLESKFQDLKAAFHKTCVISYPHFDEQFILQTDSSDYGIGAVLYQTIEERDKIVAIVSRVLKESEQHFSATEKEANAIVWSIHKLREYLIGRHFVIRTDHKALIFLIVATPTIIDC